LESSTISLGLLLESLLGAQKADLEFWRIIVAGDRTDFGCVDCRPGDDLLKLREANGNGLLDTLRNTELIVIIVAVDRKEAHGGDIVLLGWGRGGNRLGGSISPLNGDWWRLLGFNKSRTVVDIDCIAPGERPAIIALGPITTAGAGFVPVLLTLHFLRSLGLRGALVSQNGEWVGHRCGRATVRHSEKARRSSQYLM
jgi:hypothetical protein